MSKTTLVPDVFAALSNGEWHSGEQLAAEMGVTRSAIWKAVGALEALGATIEAVAHRGYRLPMAITLLDVANITATLSVGVRDRIRAAEVAWSLPSTNDVLLARAGDAPAAGQFDVLVAEHQSAGRGRRSRQWFAPPGGALCLSLGWSFNALPKGASALSLAMGVCVLRALRARCPQSVQLKWPNDLIAQGRKLGGILIELRAESAGPAYVVIGVGINCALGELTRSQVRGAGTEPIDLATLGATSCDRNALAAGLINEMLSGVMDFEHSGLSGFLAEWAVADALVGKVVQVAGAHGDFIGHARGIDADGALCVQGRSGIERFNSGEVTVRAQT